MGGRDYDFLKLFTVPSGCPAQDWSCSIASIIFQWEVPDGGTPLGGWCWLEQLHGTYWWITKVPTLWWTNILPWKIIIFNGKIHYKWPFSIAMLVHQRVALTFMGVSWEKLGEFGERWAGHKTWGSPPSMSHHSYATPLRMSCFRGGWSPVSAPWNQRRQFTVRSKWMTGGRFRCLGNGWKWMEMDASPEIDVMIFAIFPTSFFGHIIYTSSNGH